MNLEILNRYHEEGWLIKQTHPTLPLTIWNYSQKTQFEGFWDDTTIQCRGLVTDTDGNIVARPFKKFFNMEEIYNEIPDEPYEVFEKLDGSMILAFWYKDQWVIASRGSFTSEQAIKGRELFNKYPIEKLDKNKTYMFEIIY